MRSTLCSPLLLSTRQSKDGYFSPTTRTLSYVWKCFHGNREGVRHSQISLKLYRKMRFVPRGLHFAKFGSNLTAFFGLAFPISIDAHAPASSNAIAIDQRNYEGNEAAVSRLFPNKVTIQIRQGKDNPWIGNRSRMGIVEQLNHSQTLVACARYRFFTSNTPFKYTERTKGTRMRSTSNEFEKKLLAETHPPPGDIGITFDGIGAFGNVKETLKELVMLPQQRPILFWKGLLTKPPLVGDIALCTSWFWLNYAWEREGGAKFISTYLCRALRLNPLLLYTRQSKDGYFLYSRHLVPYDALFDMIQASNISDESYLESNESTLIHFPEILQAFLLQKLLGCALGRFSARICLCCDAWAEESVGPPQLG
ncbi:hypothetical protein Sango_0235100 [Sesamum angolense]|uniref:Uncharacterized protein n=1 Tax=Sesamum angolense TaxID=2727404 RepID=A0AAE2C791_9LAMI|nr:hypothetical protein Sango_0235100 [Sesamum angolense]